MVSRFDISRHRRAAKLIVAAFLIAPDVSYAAGQEHQSISDLIEYWINFLLYVAGMFFLLRGAASSAWVARRTRIQEVVRGAAGELADAEADLKVAEQTFRSIEADQRKAKDEILHQAEIEASAVIAAAKERAQRSKHQAEELLAGESRAAEAQFKADLVARAVELAKQDFASGAHGRRDEAYRKNAIQRAGRLVQ